MSQALRPEQNSPVKKDNYQVVNKGEEAGFAGINKTRRPAP